MNQYDYGINQELIMLEKLKQKFPNIRMTQDRYNNFDYVDEENKILIELKSRRINSDNKYPSTILGSNKIQNGLLKKKEGYTVYYFFNYLDCIKYYRLKKKDKFSQAYFNDKYHTFIPNEKLKSYILI